jgi:hypothetical protein
VFVIPDETFRSYRIKGGHFLQFYTDIKEAADELTEKDSKPRLANEPEDAPPEPEPAATVDEAIDRIGDLSEDFPEHLLENIHPQPLGPIGSRASHP